MGLTGLQRPMGDHGAMGDDGQQDQPGLAGAPGMDGNNGTKCDQGDAGQCWSAWLVIVDMPNSNTATTS